MHPQCGNIGDPGTAQVESLALIVYFQQMWVPLTSWRMHRFFRFFCEIDEGLIVLGSLKNHAYRSGISVAIVDKILHHIIEALANQSDIHTHIHKKVSIFSTTNN